MFAKLVNPRFLLDVRPLLPAVQVEALTDEWTAESFRRVFVVLAAACGRESVVLREGGHFHILAGGSAGDEQRAPFDTKSAAQPRAEDAVGGQRIVARGGVRPAERQE